MDVAGCTNQIVHGAMVGTESIEGPASGSDGRFQALAGIDHGLILALGSTILAFAG